MIKEYLEIGEIVGTHGVRGELRVNPFCDTPDFFTRFKTLYFDGNGCCAVKVKASRPHGNIVLLKIEGTDTVEDAQKLRGKLLYMKRSDAKLKEGTHFIAELIDCTVKDADSDITYGTLTDVSRTGANDVWHITDENGREYLIPAIPQVVIDVDVSKGIILIRPMKGIFEDED